jgi:hypothetical protein
MRKPSVLPAEIERDMHMFRQRQSGLSFENIGKLNRMTGHGARSVVMHVCAIFNGKSQTHKRAAKRVIAMTQKRRPVRRRK